MLTTKLADNPGKTVTDIIDIDLQMFSEGGPENSDVGSTPAGEPVSAEQPAGDHESRPGSLKELFDEFYGASETQPAGQEPGQTGQEPGQQPSVQTPEWMKDVPDKFKNADGSVNVEAMLKSYLNLEPKLTELGNERANLLRQLEQLRAQAPAQQAQPGTAQPAQPQISPEQIQKLNEQFVEDLLNPEKNPLQIITSIAQAAAQAVVNQNILPQIQPLVEKSEYDQHLSEWNRQVEAVRSQSPDFDQLKPVMAEILSEPATDASGQPVYARDEQGNILYGPDGPVPMTMGEYLSGIPNAVRIVYDLAKARQAQAIKTPEELLSDPDFIAKAVQSDAIKQAVLKAHAESIRSGQPPTVIGSQPAAAPPATPPEKITSTEQAGSRFREFLKSVTGL